jgi:transcriptional regulator with XRE-family HTH domain
MNDSNVISRAKELFEESGKTLAEVGARMKYKNARQGVWMLLNRRKNPRIDTLERFVEALGYKMEDLVK